MLAPAALDKIFFTHLKLCLATAIHNFKWVKTSYIPTFGIQIEAYANLANSMHSPEKQAIDGNQ